MSTAKVSELRYYPVKGLAGISVEQAVVTPAGLLHDRNFMLVNPDGTFLSQRTDPAMAPLRVAVLADSLQFSADGADTLEVPIRYDGKRRDVSLFNHWFGTGVAQDPAADKWFSERLGRPAALVRVTPEHDRPGWGVHKGQTGFGDAHALMITSLSSLDGLNERIVDRGGDAIPMNRFRPNIVIAGWDEPHTEDRVLRASAGELEFGYAARSIRCAVPTVDQATGRKTGPEPTRTLATYRRQPDYGGGVSFGMKASVLAAGTIHVGDEILVHDWLPEGDDPAPSAR
ncbi:MOSC domain-containing protein [Kribbella qitaiheensis]|uniref:MOSC domain-containing protein n=1 Tax=Kribbella qitaiheensis TaxID=1544730 RepID=A0A7G6X3F7_9ACTN|nr:MOSC N-terminal beta barrel domain-containing protein [Kribbella qitaiheensis]QNE20772.1 MOSC domain-containing protein [Kribbella qitaiheensis]